MLYKLLYNYCNEKEVQTLISSQKPLHEKTYLNYQEAQQYIVVADCAFLRYRQEDDFPKTIVVFGNNYIRRTDLDSWYEFYRRDFKIILDKEKLKEKELLFLEETYCYLGISDTTVRRHERYGLFPERVQRYGKIYFRRSELDEWLKTYVRNKSVKPKN